MQVKVARGIRRSDVSDKAHVEVYVIKRSFVLNGQVIQGGAEGRVSARGHSSACAGAKTKTKPSGVSAFSPFSAPP